MLSCEACGREYRDDPPWRCECGHALDFADEPRPNRETPGSLDRDRGLWAFESFLPVERRVTLGEGWTPLVDAPDRDCQFKLDYLFPTGSFKDRGATATVSRAVELGVDRVVEDSSGNAGLAIATYAAGAGIDAEIYVPADAKPGKLRAIERTGADVVRVEGTRRDVTDACLEAVESAGDSGGDRDCGDGSDGDRDGGDVDGDGDHSDCRASGWYASHAWNPAFFAGTSTIAMEIAAQRDWDVPDAVVTPLGHGTLFLGAYRGFRALRDAGWTDSLPRLLGAQAAGASPIADSLRDGSDSGGGSRDGSDGDGGRDDGIRGDDAAGPRNDAADGSQIRDPARGDQIRAAIAATDGDAVAVGADETERECERLGRAGFHVEPTSATATAALERCRASGAVSPDDDVVVVLTGTGLKG